MNRGIVLFGINTERVDYIQLAVMCAGFIKKNMPGTQICLLTDQNSIDYHNGKNMWQLCDYFAHVKLVPQEKEKFENLRAYRDTQYYSFTTKFKNENRASVYDLSPFDETLLIDSDYLICNDVLSSVWGSAEQVMINNQAVGLMHNQMHDNEIWLNAYGIRMYWATAVYFKKSDKAKLLFDLVEHIKDNWVYYKLTYDFPGNLFRNDFAFSIAIHILSGFIDQGNFVAPLPDDTILTATDRDQFYKIKSAKELVFFANDAKETWKFYASKTKALNVHCMNKLSLLNNTDKIMEALNA
jgi:hypothetical protein